jgi:nitrous oxidase accessory protein NosD
MTGLAIYSAVPAHLVIRDNYIHDNSVGLCLSNRITARRLDDNGFDNVRTNVVTG